MVVRIENEKRKCNPCIGHELETLKEIEMEKFKGLVCVNNQPFPMNDIGPDLTLGKEYSLNDTFVCDCGEEHYDVGLPLQINFVECYKCRQRLPDTTHWCHSSRFIQKI